MVVEEPVTRDSGPCEHVCRADAVSRSVVVDVCRIRDRRGPERRITTILPVDSGMKNHGTSHFADCLNDPFGDAILMMCVGPAELQFLVRFIDVRHEGISLKSSTASQAVLNDNAIVHAHSLKLLFSPNCFAIRKPNLMLNMYVRRGMVNKDATSLEGGRGWLAEGIICSSAKSGLKVVHRDSCSRYHMSILEGDISFRDNCLLGRFLGAS
jgi:hypothetical protein